MSPCRLVSTKAPRFFVALRLCISLLSWVTLSAYPKTGYCEGSTAHQDTYQEVYLTAESLVKQGRTREAISVYKGALRELQEDGRVHLRLAQLTAQLKDPTLNAWIAHHYLMCHRDQRLDRLIRDQICQRELKKRFSPLRITGGPVALELLAPAPFIGPIKANMNLPNGPLKLRFQRQGATQAEVLDIVHPSAEPLNLGPKSFMPSRPKLSASELLGTAPPSPQGKPPESSQGEALPPRPAQDPFAVTDPTTVSPPRAVSLPQWPAYLLFSLSVASAGAGAYFYMNIDQFRDNYLGKELPTVLWGSSAAMAIVGGGWLAISW